MAWWNQPEGSVTPTVTLRRLAAWMAERGHRYDLDLSEGVVHFSVAGFDYVLMVVDRRILAVRAHHRLAAALPGSTELSRVRSVAQEVSSSRLIPAFYTEVDDAGLGLCAEVLTNIGAGLDDAQLAGMLDALDRLEADIVAGIFAPEVSDEDVHTALERGLIERAGDDLGGRLRAGRSRNDQTATTVRLYLRDRLTDLEGALLDFLGVLLDCAERHRPVIVSGYTHLQQAQPISLGHYWMAWFEAFLRDCGRLEFALDALNECPLGAGALAGATLPLDRACWASTARRATAWIRSPSATTWRTTITSPRSSRCTSRALRRT